MGHASRNFDESPDTDHHFSDLVLVNTARGAIVGVLDLLDPGVLPSPHAALYSVEAEGDLRRKAAQNLIDWARRGRPAYVVVEGATRVTQEA